MWLLIVIINATYVTDVRFQEFTSKAKCDIAANTIKSQVESVVVTCMEK